jgi:hypothetical protein
MRRPARAAQSFQLPFKTLQFVDPRRDMRDMLIEQCMCGDTVTLRVVTYA